MKYKTAQSMAAELRWLADFIEEQGVELPSEYGWSDPEVRLSIYGPKSKKKFVQATRALMSQGIVKKEFDSDAVVRKQFGNHVKVAIHCSRSEVCTPTIVGTEEVPEKLYVETGRIITREVIEWKCDPLLAD